MWSLFILGLVAGLLMPLQAALNFQLGKSLQHPLQASFISFLVGTLSLLFILLGMKIPPFQFHKWPVAPYLFLGGVFGAFFVTSGLFLVSRLGAVTMTALLIAGQFLASGIMDHFGLFGVPVRPLTPLKLVGLLCLFLGIFLVKGPK